MSKLEEKVFRAYNEDNKSIEKISIELGITEKMVRAIILRKMKSS